MFPANTKILVVDDMNSIRTFMVSALKELNYMNIVEASDGAGAWKIINDAASGPEPIQLVFSDMMMPEMTGLELLKKVRDCPGTQSLPFLFVTSEGETDAVLAAATLKADGYVLKPMDKEVITIQMERVWKRRSP